MKPLFKLGSERHEKGRVLFTWHPKGKFLASVGKNATVYITDRQGFIEDEIDLKKSNGSILSLEWDKDGLYLAILQEGNNILFLWHSTKKILSEIDIGYKDVSILSWSKTGPQLAVCTLKGNLFLYNKETKKNLSIMGKHSKKISSGRWSTEGNYLALGSDDNMVSISTENGDTVLETDVRFTPIESSFVSLTNGPENGLACNLDGKLLFLFYFKNEKEAPIELAFGCDDGDTNSNSKCKYGIIRHHESINSTLVLVGFSLGYLLTVAISGDELGQEQCVGRFFTTNLITFAFNPASEVVAVAGDDGIRFVDISDLKERSSEYISSEQIEYGKIQHLAWSPNGQMLTVSSSAGNVYCFLAKSNSLFCSYKSKVAYLSSFQEVTLIDSTMVTSKQDQKIIPLSMEPEHLSIGENYLTTSTGNKLCVYSLSSDTDTSNDSPLIMEQEFNADITDIQSNKTHLAALTSDAKVSILSIDSGSDGPRSSNKSNHIAIPDKNNNHDDHHSLSTDIQITCMAITKAHLYFGTDSGTVQIFALDEWILVPGIKLQLESAVTGVYPNLIGTRAVVASSDGSVYLFSPVSAPTTIQLASAPTTVVSVLWDLLRKDVFMIYDGENIHTYMYVSSSYRGSYVVKLGPVTISVEGGVLMEPSKFKLSTGYRPLTTRSGRLTCVTSSGSLTEVIHPYFDQLGPDSKLERERLSRLDPDDKDDQTTILRWFAQAIGLLCLESAWESALMLRRRELWLALSGKAVETLNIDLAIRVYRQLLDAGMVMSLQSIASVEDRLLLSGHISLLFNDHDRAQELFLQSSDPSAALRLRCDLLQWEEAYKIAKALASTQLCDVTARYALQLEQQAEYESALKLFESCLEPQTLHGKHLPASVGTVRESVESGLCRCELRLGNLRKGIKLAYELNVTSLFQECGDILEQQKQYSEAADLHLKAMDFERAAFIYTKNIARSDPSRIKEAAAVLAKVSNDQLNIAFAKLCIIAGDYVEAMHAYSRANDFEKVVEIKLRHLDQGHIQEAFDIVRRHPTDASATLIADYCNQISNYRGTIEFCLLANRFDEAFKVAQSHNLVDLYSSFQGDGITPEEAVRVAHYYEKTQEYKKAGRFYTLAAQYQRALKLYFQCGASAIDDAIDVVGKSNSETLTHQMIDYLTGDIDGVPKDTTYIYKLYIALKRYEEAANTALLIANNEQELGNYSLAHTTIFEAMRYLEDSHVKIPSAMRQKFILLHSYLLVKTLARQNNHTGAARLLLRVTQHISKFPQHTVPILTSAVIECQRAGLKASCYEFASTLMRPEYRSLMNPDLKRKVEAIVRRKSTQNDDVVEGTSPCPLTGSLIPNYQLECPTTRDALPMCVVTGRHMVLDDWCFCPVSGAPALYSEYVRYINFQLTPQSVAEDDMSNDNNPTHSHSKVQIIQAIDPVLGKPVSIENLRKSSHEEAIKYIRWFNNLVDEVEKDSTDATVSDDHSDNNSQIVRKESLQSDDSDCDGDSGGTDDVSGDELQLMQSSKTGPRRRRHSRHKRQANKNSTRFRAAKARRASKAYNK